MSAPTYLGDAVYAEWGDQRIVLTTSTGDRVTNRIVLEAPVWFALMRWAARGTPEQSWNKTALRAQQRGPADEDEEG